MISAAQLQAAQPTDFLLVLMVVALAFADMFLGFAMWEAGRMSDKKFDATKKNVQKQIDQINQQLNPPA